MFGNILNDSSHNCQTCWHFRFPSVEEYEEAKKRGLPTPVVVRGCRGPRMDEESLKKSREQGYCVFWKNAYSRKDRLLAFLHLKKLKRRGLLR